MLLWLLVIALIIFAVLLVALAAWAVWHRADFDPQALRGRLQALGAWEGPAFVLIYAAALREIAFFISGRVVLTWRRASRSPITRAGQSHSSTLIRIPGASRGSHGRGRMKGKDP